MSPVSKLKLAKEELLTIERLLYKEYLRVIFVCGLWVFVFLPAFIGITSIGKDTFGLSPGSFIMWFPLNILGIISVFSLNWASKELERRFNTTKNIEALNREKRNLKRTIEDLRREQEADY